MQKQSALPQSIHWALAGKLRVPEVACRDILVLPPQKHPNKKGLSTIEGQARLLHDLANIELQAMELALRSIAEFHFEDPQFLDELGLLALSESKHLDLCLQGLAELGFAWGDWPIHTVLWDAVGANDSLLDRILIVHRYLEGGGLDAGEILIQRLKGVAPSKVHEVVHTIVSEEVGHVNFGTKWYKHFCHRHKKDPDHDFKQRFADLKVKLPKRIERTSVELRKRAGFTDAEIECIDNFKAESLKNPRSASSLLVNSQALTAPTLPS